MGRAEDFRYNTETAAAALGGAAHICILQPI